MEDLSRIEARLESLGELGELVRALRSMAASRAREAQEAREGTRAYRATIERAIAEIAPFAPPAPDGADGCERPNRADAPNRAVRIVVGSEHGFVGGFNARLIDAALEGPGAGADLIVVGRRAGVTLAERGQTPRRAYPATPRMGGVTALARTIAGDLGSVTGVDIVFARSRPGAAFHVETRAVLPLPSPAGAPPGYPPLHHLPAGELLTELAGAHLFAEIADALMESLAAENNARLRTMDAASHNIDDRLEALQRQERAARQEQTTSDMLDVVTGAEAVNGA